MRLPDGAPFFDHVVVGVTRSGWPFIVVTLGLDETGWPVVNRMVIERHQGHRAICTSESCKHTVWLLTLEPAIEPVQCPKCSQGTLVELSWSHGPSGEIFGGQELGADVSIASPGGRFGRTLSRRPGALLHIRPSNTSPSPSPKPQRPLVGAGARAPLNDSPRRRRSRGQTPSTRFLSFLKRCSPRTGTPAICGTRRYRLDCCPSGSPRR